MRASMHISQIEMEVFLEASIEAGIDLERGNR